MTTAARYRILCVDDQDDILEIAKVCLSLDPAFEVRCCNSGADALKVITSWQPDLIVLDVVMPGMDGPETMREIRKLPETSDTPIAFVTARSDLESLSDLMVMGAAGVIAKPFKLRDLSKQVRAILES